MKQLFTSITEVRSYGPCAAGLVRLLEGKKGVPYDDLFPLSSVLGFNTVSDVCWLLGKRRKEISICVQFARKCADSVAHLRVTSSTDATQGAAQYAVDVAQDAVDAAQYAEDAVVEATEATARYAAAEAAEAAHYAEDAEDALRKQQAKNKQFLLDCILQYESGHD